MRKQRKFNIAIIGGGAAGLTAAIAAARQCKQQKKELAIVVIEKNQRVGKKILVTGNGKCNITNLSLAPNHYHSNEQSFPSSIISRFPPLFILDFFQSIGLFCKEDENGRMYPLSKQASSVLELLRLELKKLSVAELCDVTITSIIKKKNKFVLRSENEEIYAEKILIATGGNSFFSPYQNDGYRYLKELGHSITPIFPALVQIKTDLSLVRALKGMRCSSKVSLLADETVIKEAYGELQFTETGLSGICIFDLSRIVSEFFSIGNISGAYYRNILIAVDLLPDFSISEVDTIIKERVRDHQDFLLEDFFVGLLNKRIGQAFLKAQGIQPLSRKSISLSSDEIKKIISSLKNWLFQPTGTLSWKNAQVTAGGADTREFHKNTLESKKVPGLYAAGEILDVDADCGGYNLQWAWSSGYLAGYSMVQDK